jgi:hypothetical protein
MMIEDIANVLTWALCAGIPTGVALGMMFILIRTLWVGSRKKRGQLA